MKGSLESYNHARDLCMLFASYDPTVYPNPRFMKWQEQPPWHVFCTPLQPGGASPVLLTGRVRVERFPQRTIRMGYLPPALPHAAVLVAEAETRLLVSIVLRPHHILRPLFPPVIIRRLGLRPRPHDFVLPDKDDCNFIPRILYRTLLQ